MDFNEILVDIILNEKYDGEKDIDWLYGEYVKRGYNKSREMFCEEFVMSMNEQEIKYLTESEVNKVTGGAGKFKKSSTSIALASALLAGSMMPTQGAGVPESRAVVSVNISNKHQGKSNQGFYEKATGILNKIFNEADVRNILAPVLGTAGVPLLGAGSIYLISRIVKRISEAKTSEEVLQNTANGIYDILNSTNRNNKDGILTLLKECLTKLITFVTQEQRSELTSKYGTNFENLGKPGEFTDRDEIHETFSEVLEAVCRELNIQPDKNPLRELFKAKEEDLKAIFGIRKSTGQPEQEEQGEQGYQEEEQIHAKEQAQEEEKPDESDEQPVETAREHPIDESAGHPNEKPEKKNGKQGNEEEKQTTYTTEELTNNAVVSTVTGISRDLLVRVDDKVKNTATDTMTCHSLEEDVMLIVCRSAIIKPEDIKDLLDREKKKDHPKALYLVLDDCGVPNWNLQGLKVKVLDLRGNTRFYGNLTNTTSIEKVLLKNNPLEEKQLHIQNCGELGPIYQMAEYESPMTRSELVLDKCHLGKNFRFVGLNKCCEQPLLTSACVSLCTCQKDGYDAILASFDPDAQPDKSGLEGVKTE